MERHGVYANFPPEKSAALNFFAATKQPDMKLRIAQAAPLWTPIPPRTYGGIELLLKLLCDELVERGHEVTLFASGDCATRARLSPVVDINLSDLIAEDRGYCYEYYTNSMLAELAARQDEFDLIHLHCSTAWLPPVAGWKTPSLFTMHTSPHHDDEWVMRRWPEVAVNGISRCQMRGLSLKLEREFPIVYNGCDFSAYEPRYEPGRYLAFLGRLSPAKNPLAAIRIAQACDLPIVLAGQPQNAGETTYFEKEIRPLIDGERVRWIGPVNHPQKSELLRQASALIFPIQWEEPFGLVMIEAMACGTPVVAHRRGSVEEVVDQGVTGFHSGSMDALPELVGQALRLDRREVQRHAEARFGYRAMVDAYETLYQRLRSQRLAAVAKLDAPLGDR
jgi:glycosyltransferase involved in cell wall biosynthesis